MELHGCSSHPGNYCIDCWSMVLWVFFSKKSLATDYLVFEDVTNLVVPSSKQVCLQHYNDPESIFPVNACVPE